MNAVAQIRPPVADYAAACGSYQHHTESAAFCLTKLGEVSRDDHHSFKYWLNRAAEELEAADMRARALGVL